MITKDEGIYFDYDRGPRRYQAAILPYECTLSLSGDSGWP